MILRLIGTIHTSAIEDGKVTANPVAKPHRLLPAERAQVEEKIRALTRKELACLLDTICCDWPEHFSVLLTLARTGMWLGEALACVKEQLGHHSIQVTMGISGHLGLGGNRQAVDRLDDPQPQVQQATVRNLSATTLKNPVLSHPLHA